MDADATAPVPGQVVRPDLDGLRALAHPLRLELLGLLRSGGPATASQLGARTGQSSGTTSYHLRQLEAQGFVVDVPERGTGRDRWWRAAQRTTQMSLDDVPGPEGSALAEQYLLVVADRYAARTRAGIAALATLDDELGDGWRATFQLSDYLFRLTLAEAQDLTRDLDELAARYRRDDPDTRAEAPDGSARVAFQLALLPAAGPQPS